MRSESFKLQTDGNLLEKHGITIATSIQLNHSSIIAGRTSLRNPRRFSKTALPSHNEMMMSDGFGALFCPYT
jgi:hypothetical protein